VQRVSDEWGFHIDGYQSNRCVVQLPAVQNLNFASSFKRHYTQMFLFPGSFLTTQRPIRIFAPECLQQMHCNTAFFYRSAVPAEKISCAPCGSKVSYKKGFLINGVQAQNLRKFFTGGDFFCRGFLQTGGFTSAHPVATILDGGPKRRSQANLQNVKF